MGTGTRRERDLIRRFHTDLDAPALQAEVVRSIHALLPVDAIFFATADPDTLLFTGGLAEDPLAAVTDRFLDNEYGQPDVNKFASLAAAPRHVATLDAATRGDRDGSSRYRDVMAPLGLGDELRAALVTPAGCWGYLCLHRADSPYGFTPAEARLIARLAPHLAHACRQAMRGRYPDSAAGGPGVVVLHPDLSVAALTGEAERWLAEMAGPRVTPGTLPATVYAVAARLRSPDPTAAPPTVHVPAVHGGWLLVHASHLGSAADSDIAVVIEPARPGGLAPILLSSQGLTPREREVALLVLRGASTRDIGATLHLSAYTVKDHLKVIFDKTGVRTRRDLVARFLSAR